MLTSEAVNLLTPAVVQAAAKEISTGEHIQLDWPLHNVQFPGFSRKEFHQKKINFSDFTDWKAMDDEVYINTQAGSQWDSLKHFAHQASGTYYNGLTHEQAKTTDTNGTHNGANVEALSEEACFATGWDGMKRRMAVQHRVPSRGTRFLSWKSKRR
jgi:hypothetical protein